MDQPKKYYFIIWIISSVFLLMGFTNQDFPDDKEDQKKLEKAQKLNYEAQEQNDKANSLYSEIAEYETTDSENTKKFKKLKEKAIDNQLSAFKLQKEANFLEYNVYKKIIPELKSKFSIQNSIPPEVKLLEEQAGELFYKAEVLRNEAYQIDKNKKDNRFAKLSKAQEFEKEGINKQKQLIDIYTGKTSVVSKTQEVSGSVSDVDVDINQELLQAYKDYINQEDSLSALFTLNSFRELIYSDSLSSSSIRNTWDNYLYTEKPVLEAEESVVEDTTVEKISRDIALQYDDSKEVITKTHDQSEDVIDDDIIYKVQIAAAKMKLAENVLKSIYQGAELIDIIEEDGWYKYSVGKLGTYEQAVNIKESTKVNGAFIVAYNNGVKVPLYLAKTGKVSSEPTHGKGIVFKVQIAADTKIISSENLHKIYSGYEKIQRYEEDAWYKYSAGEFKTFNEANKFRENCGVKGAFVIAFQGGKKINVLAAKKMLRCYDPKIISDWPSNNDQVIFRVQIAASNKEM